MDDADLSTALGAIVPFSMPMTGQICFSLTRVLVSKKRHDEVVDAYKQAVNSIVVGDPWKEETQMGPLSMKRQLDRVMGYLEKGRNEGAKLVTGGGRPKDMNRGYFVEPTIFSNVSSDMTIAKEEIFGPVVSVMPYENEEDAIRIANNSTYGLSGAVFTKDPEKGFALAKRMRTGNVTVNGLNLQINAPFGATRNPASVASAVRRDWKATKRSSPSTCRLEFAVGKKTRLSHPSGASRFCWLRLLGDFAPS